MITSTTSPRMFREEEPFINEILGDCKIIWKGRDSYETAEVYALKETGVNGYYNSVGKYVIITYPNDSLHSKWWSIVTSSGNASHREMRQEVIDEVMSQLQDLDEGEQVEVLKSEF